MEQFEIGKGNPAPATDSSRYGNGVVDAFVQMLSGVIPVLDQIKQSIQETSGNIPKAASQLDSVTKATESATVQILNVLDAIVARLGRAEGNLVTLKASRKREGEAVRRAHDQLRVAKESHWTAEHLAQLDNSYAELGMLLGSDDSVQEVEEVLAETKNDTMNIAMALQVQDITTQQIAGVTHMIEQVRLQLTNVLENFDGRQALEPGSGPQAPVQQHFDSDAQFANAADRQDRADAIINQWKKEDYE